MRRRLALLTLLCLAGCGTHQPPPATSPLASTPVSQWPTPADYTTLTVAETVRNDALYRYRDPRVKAFLAYTALRSLLTIGRLAPGPCADHVAALYGNLRDLLDAHPGEDWRPLILFVRREPTVAQVCRPAPAAA